MGVITSSVTTNSGLDILKTLKEMLKTGWTLDEENQILWKDSPAAFPVGIWADSTYSTSNDYIQAIVKKPDGTPYKYDYSNGYAYYFSKNTKTTHYISVYTSPNGSIGIGFGTSSAVLQPRLLIAKNANTDSTKPQYTISSHGPSNNALFVPGIAESLNSLPSLDVSIGGAFYSGTWSLVNAFDVYTGTALADVYYLAGRQDSTKPTILTSGSNKYIRIYEHSNSTTAHSYMRYV